MPRLALTLIGAFAIGGLTTPAAAQTEPSAGVPTAAPPSDPWEKANRVFFLVGGAIDIAIVRPVAVFYAHAAPKPAREGVHNVVDNLGQPVNVVNRVLQLRPREAATTAGRFVLNSTVGVGGVFDVASSAGLPPRNTSFGQTLSRYGVAQGPYLFIPVIGPSSLRDAAGKVVDAVLDPFNYVSFRDDAYFFASRTVLTGVDARVRADPALKAIQKSSTDPYVALRSAYLQNANFADNGEVPDVKALPDFGPEPAPAKP